MRIRTALLLFAALSPLAACGYTEQELTMATLHTCEAQRIAREMEAQPQPSDSLQEDFDRRTRYFGIVVEGARDPELLREAAQEAACE